MTNAQWAFWRPKGELRDWLPWLEPILEPAQEGESFHERLQRSEIVMTASGGLLRCARLYPPDFESESPETLVAYHDRIEAACARFGLGWSVWIDQWRTKAPGYFPDNDFGGNRAAQLIEASRKRQFTNLARPVFKNTPFIAVHYSPQRRDAMLGWMMDHADDGAKAHIDFFKEKSESLFQEIRHAMHDLTILSGDALASYLSACVTFEPKKTMVPVGALRSQLATRDWHTSGEFRVDDRHVVTVELRNFGSPSPATLEWLHEVDFECRWTTAFHGLDIDGRRKELNEVRKGWDMKRKGPGAWLTEIITRNPFAAKTDPEAERNVLQLDAMQAELSERPFALAHCNVHVWHDAQGLTGNDKEDRAAHLKARRAARDKASYVAATLNSGPNLDARIATLNDVYAPLGDLPGNVTRETENCRRIRVEMGAITRLSPVTGVSTGSREDWRFGGSALLAGLTRRGSPFYWALNAPGSDVPHTAIIGRTGSGKSALMALMAAQFLRYKDARVIVFDRKRSFMVPCLALGGDWLELGSGGVGVQPLRAIHHPAEMAWAQEWVEKALRTRGLTVTQRTGAAVSDALRHVADRDPDERTLSMLWTCLGADADARHALSHYLDGPSGPYGKLFDGVVGSYGAASVIGIETQDIMQLEGAAPLVMSAVFRAMQRDYLVGNGPKLVNLDESHAFFKNDLWRGTIESWAREMRKLMAALTLATQSLHDYSSESARVIFDQIANKVYLPNPEAMRDDVAKLYRDVGLLDQQIHLLARAQPKGEYLLQTEQATRLVQFKLEDDALALCGASSPADHARAFELLEMGIEPGAQFTEAWLSQGTREWLAQRGVSDLVAAE